MLDQTIAHYRVQEKIGAGGMGEVYRASDTRLKRDVALKVLPELFAGDAQRMARFKREAELLAALNHPHIAHIYGLEEANGVRALVMELVEGPALPQRIAREPMPSEEALPIGLQIAEALEYAHERGIIHRDLKPANIKLTPDGQVKLLDFGLAKALEGEVDSADISTSPTLSAAATRAGVLLGTAAYMSPEQAKGKAVDRRADIWAFGCVLYEMLTGRPAFDGETITDTLAAVVRAEPDWSSLPTKTPRRIGALLRRCLTKDPKQRLQAIGEARIAIAAAIAGAPEDTTSPAATAPSPALWRRAVPWALAAVAATLAIAAGAPYWRASRPESHQVMRASLMLPEPLAGVFLPNPGSPFALSRDGSRLTFVGSPAGKPPQLYLREIELSTVVPILGTENATEPFFSLDGEWIGFFADGKLRKVARTGGPVTALCDGPIPHGGSWSSDDTIIYAPNLGSGLMRISSAGGTPQTLTTPDAIRQEISHRWPQVLPDNKTVLFTIQLTTQVTYDDAGIALLSLDTGKWRTLFQGGSYARYVPSGHIVYVRSGALMAVPFDLARLQVTGSPAPVQQGVVTTVATSGGAEYDVADSGLLAYVPGSTRPPERTLVWVDRQGIGKEIPAPLNTYVAPRISPDGKLLAVQIFNAGAEDLWIYDFGRITMMRLTFSGGGGNAAPVWTPDGRRVLYRSRVPTLTFRSKLADGSGAEETLFGKELEDPGATPFSVTPDGKTLLFGRRTTTGSVGIYAISLDGSGEMQPFLQSTFTQTAARFSPDGRWVVYHSNESGRDEIYVQPYPGPGGKWMLSTEGGTYPLWANSGHEIFYRNEDKMMVVPVETRSAFKAGTPLMLFRTSNYLMQGNYDVAPDGQHFLMLKEKEAPASSKELSIVTNWTEELKRLVPSVAH
jgi:serine/threonine protein kinase/Tol biopolymer transport system component